MRRTFHAGLAALFLTTSGLGLGCESLPGSRGQQGAVIGGAAGAATGAAIAKENRLLGALIGGALGAGGGYLIGARTSWFGNDRADDEAREAIRAAQYSPASVADAENATTADLNNDGFVTIDELVALEQTGISDDEMLRRLRMTDQVFDLNAAQERELRQAGISARVISEMQKINAEERNEILAGRRQQR